MTPPRHESSGTVKVSWSVKLARVGPSQREEDRTLSSTVIRNSRAGDEAPLSPTHEDGTRYPFSIHFDGAKYIGYADTPEELLGLLIPGYLDLSPQEQQVARIRLAISVQVATQARINAEADPDAWDALSDAEKEVLQGSRLQQPRGWGDADGMGDVWDSEVVLVLVETGYAPYSEVDRPISGIADVVNPPNILWLRPVDDWDFLESLAAAGFIDLFEATDI